MMGASQPHAPRKLSPAITAVPEDNPPLGSPGRIVARSIISLSQPDPWVYVFQGRQPYEPKKLAPPFIAVPEDNPPFRHGGFRPQTATIIAIAQPDPWSWTFTGGRHPYSQRKLHPSALGLSVDNPPFQYFGRTQNYQSIIRAWEPPPPTPLVELYTRQTVVQTRRVVARGYIVSFGARRAVVNYPPVTAGGPYAMKYASLMAWQRDWNGSPHQWVFQFLGGHQPYAPQKLTPS